MLFTLWESLRAPDSALLRVRSKELRLHPQTPSFWSPQAFATLGFITILCQLKYIDSLGGSIYFSLGETHGKHPLNPSSPI